MKILFCLGSMKKGGAERVIANLSNEFIKKYDIDIVVTSFEKSMYKLDPQINLFNLDNDNKRYNIFLRTYRRIKKLKKILKSENPDIIVSLLPEPTFRIMILKIFLNIKTIISVRNDPNIEYNSIFKKFLVRILYFQADGFIFQTPDAQKWFPKKIQKKSVVIPNPINKDFVCKPYNGKREKTIVTVGRLEKQKNHKLLIRSFSEVLKKHDDYILKIYGSGTLKLELEKLIEKLNLKDSVKLMGEVSNIKEEIYKSALFVLSSDYEGMPNALMEAMALGLPCVSTNCPIGGPKYLINNKKNGILVNTNDNKELTQAINFLIENDSIARNIGYNANKICKELNPHKIYSEWEQYILNVERGK